MTLSQVSQGKKVTLVSLNLSEKGSNRLTALGLVPGVQIQLINNSLTDISLIECKGTRLALGRGLSRQVEVK